MNMQQLQEFFGWCAVFNFALLFFWFLMMASAGGIVHRLHGRWFHMPRERFDEIHYAGMAFYKLLVIVFNVMPWLALRVMAG